MTFHHYPKRKLIFNHTAKTGGWAIRNFLGSAASVSFGKPLGNVSEETRVVSIFRKPLDRFVSACQMIKYGTERRPSLEIEGFDYDMAMDIIEDENLELQWKPSDPKALARCYLLPQSAKENGLTYCDKVWLFQDLEDFWRVELGAEPQHGNSALVALESLSERQAERFIKIFKKDLKLYQALISRGGWFNGKILLDSWGF